MALSRRRSGSNCPDFRCTPQFMEEPAATTPEPQFDAGGRNRPFAVDPLEGMLQRVWLRTRRRKAWLDSLNRTRRRNVARGVFQRSRRVRPASARGSNPARDASGATPSRSADRWLECGGRRAAATTRRSSFAFPTAKPICSRRPSPCASTPRSVRSSVTCKAATSARFSPRRWPRGSSARMKIHCRGDPANRSMSGASFDAGESSTGEAEPLVSDPIISRAGSPAKRSPDASLGGILRNAHRLARH